MQPQLNEIRDQQRETWNKFSGGWKKWDEFTMNFLKSSGDALIQKLDIQKADTVLDIASGTGEPALTIAAIATEGKVVATDLAEQMLETAKERALNKAIENFETLVADVSELPFEDNSFDKISCRFGFMFFPDMQLAANEMFRVLKEGGRMATSVWFTPQKNTWITGITRIINKNIQLPPPPDGAPSMFRCAIPGLIKSLLEKAGFKNVKEEEVNGIVRYDDFDHFWTITNDVVAPVVSALSKAGDSMRKKIKEETEAFSKQYITPNGLELEYSSLIISGEK
jgi:ubiquinone/menaquinone biosynthesis C-methylase UbiE